MTSINAVSTLFSSLKTSSTFGSFNFADYAAIRNGSYGKLLKAYYAQQNTSTTANKSSVKKNNNALTTDTTGLSQVKTAADSLKSAANALEDESLWKETNGSYDWDKISKAVQSFADSYNNVVSQASKTTSSEVTQTAGRMTSLSTALKNSLGKAGITIGSDQKLTVDTEALKSADIKTLKTLFTGSYSYAEQISQKANSISSAALRGTGLYSGNGTFTSSISSFFNTTL